MMPGKEKLFIMLALITVIALGVLPGCGKPAPEISLDVNGCADMLLKTIAFRDDLTAVGNEIAGVLYQTGGRDVLEQKIYVSSGATAEEIAIFEAANPQAARNIEKAVLQRLTEQKASFKDYLPAELPKLEDPFLLVRDKYVILCLSDDNEKVKTELDKYFDRNNEPERAN